MSALDLRDQESGAPTPSWGRHAAPRDRSQLSVFFRRIPTMQEALLWEQRRRHGTFDAVEDWWIRRAHALAVGTFLLMACAVGAGIGALIPMTR
ncbi:MAG: hypothetical protein EON52_25770 [Actinomycetales bacterium]|nr:MAG: hypothetical protein EON52_25770 [Actinomycetales bacterium]